MVVRVVGVVWCCALAVQGVWCVFFFVCVCCHGGVTFFLYVSVCVGEILGVCVCVQCVWVVTVRVCGVVLLIMVCVSLLMSATWNHLHAHMCGNRHQAATHFRISFLLRQLTKTVLFLRSQKQRNSYGGNLQNTHRNQREPHHVLRC